MMVNSLLLIPLRNHLMNEVQQKARRPNRIVVRTVISIRVSRVNTEQTGNLPASQLLPRRQMAFSSLPNHPP